MINLKQFKQLFPNSKDAEEWVQAMEKYFPIYGITTNKRIAAFISQCGHESAGWRIFKESLNYSEFTLNSVFSKYFKQASRPASKFARKPEQIANIVYANRMGNRDTGSGDGWKYRGRGPIQLTGKNNYLNFSKFINNPSIITDPDQVSDNKEIGLLAAIWYWEENKLNFIADTGDVKALTRKINGGYNGLEERQKKYDECLLVLESDIPFYTLKVGARGVLVQKVQRALGINADGIFGKFTEQYVKSWQRNNGLISDGIVGPITYRLLINE